MIGWSSRSASSPRRVLFPFVGDTVGGSHISALELVEGLDSSRFMPIVAVHKGGILSSYLSGRGIGGVWAPELGLDPFTGKLLWDMIATFLTVVRLVRFLRRYRIGIIHTHDARMHFLWGLAAKLTNARFVLHMRARVQSRIGISCRFADSIILISEYCRGGVPAKVSRKVQVVRNPFRLPCPGNCRVQCRDRLISAAPKSVGTIAIVGYVANFMHRKRPEVFVEMAARLRDRFGNHWFFPMFGETDGMRVDAVTDSVKRKIAELGLTSSCVLMGPRFPIEPWIMGCDVLVVPAVGEPFGRTLVEAMLCGTPVVAADDGGHREIVRHREDGLLARADDASAFADAVGSLYRDPEMAKRISATAMVRAMNRYSIESHVERVQAIYDSL